jgi:HAD superfamily hydrolase (TIGR01549 family)
MRAVIFDLDGTLVDTVYGHVLAWQHALAEAGMEIAAWKVHRLIGMSGGLLARAAAHEIGRELSPDDVERLQRRHGEAYQSLVPERRALPGARDLLRHLRERRIAHGIATSGKREDVTASLAALEIPPDLVVVDRSDVERAKPEPDLFLACYQRLASHGGSGAPLRVEECYVIGDSVWDLLAARRAGMLAIGLLSGGYGEAELTSAGAYRVYRDPEEMLASVYQLGLRDG